MESVALGHAVDSSWAAACDEHAADGLDPAALPGYRRTWLRYKRKAYELADFLAHRPELEPLPEVELRSADGLLRGTADLVLRAVNSVAIVDHKTGLVREADAPKEAYERQLQLYAALARATYGLPVTEATLLSLREGSVAVDVDEAVVDNVEQEARQRLRDYNARVPGAQPAAASESACQWCPYAATCDGFWAAVEPSWVEKIGVCVRGAVTQVEVAANGSASILLDVRSSNAELDPSVLVSGLDAGDVAEVSVGAAVDIAALRWHPRNALALLPTSRTTLAVS